jgi:hypothetical protein
MLVYDLQYTGFAKVFTGETQKTIALPGEKSNV